MLIKEHQVNLLFKHLCNPEGKLTANTLGHALQKHKIEFTLKDVSDMLRLYYDKKGIEPVSTGRMVEQEGEEEEIDLGIELDQRQFTELYGMARKLPKGGSRPPE